VVQRFLKLCAAITKGRAESLTEARKQAMDVTEILRVLYSRSTHPVLFAMMYDASATDEAFRSCPDFYELEAALQKAVRDASTNFARLRATDTHLLMETLTDIAGALPSTEPNIQPLKSFLIERAEIMSDRHNTRIDKYKTEASVPSPAASGRRSSHQAGPRPSHDPPLVAAHQGLL
jgi:hypothetical protein